MSQPWVRFCDDVIPNRWNPALVGKRCKAPPKSPTCGFLPFIECVNGPRGVCCLGPNSHTSRRAPCFPARRPRAARRRYRSCSPRRPYWCAARRSRSCSPGPRKASPPRAKCGEVALPVDCLRVPTECEAHILQHMRCRCSACMDFACRWRRALKRQFERQLKEPPTPPCKPQRWAPVVGRKLSPDRAKVFDKDCRNVTTRRARSPHKARKHAPANSPKVSWWFGNYVPSSEADSEVAPPSACVWPKSMRDKPCREFFYSKANPDSSESSGFSAVAMDGTMAASRLTDHKLWRSFKDPSRQECVSDCRSLAQGDTRLSPHRPRRYRRPLVQGIASDGFLPADREHQAGQDDHTTYSSPAHSRQRPYHHHYPYWLGDGSQNKSSLYDQTQAQHTDIPYLSPTRSPYGQTGQSALTVPHIDYPSVGMGTAGNGSHNKAQSSIFQSDSPARGWCPNTAQYGFAQPPSVPQQATNPHTSPLFTTHKLTNEVRSPRATEWAMQSSPMYNKPPATKMYTDQYWSTDHQPTLPEYTKMVSQSWPARRPLSSPEAKPFSPMRHTMQLQAGTVKGSQFTPHHAIAHSPKLAKLPAAGSAWSSLAQPQAKYKTSLASPDKLTSSTKSANTYSYGSGPIVSPTLYKRSPGDTMHLGNIKFNRYSTPSPYIHLTTGPSYLSPLLSPAAPYRSALLSGLTSSSLRRRSNLELYRLINKYCPVYSPHSASSPYKLHIPTIHYSPVKTDQTLQRINSPTGRSHDRAAQTSQTGGDPEEKVQCVSKEKEGRRLPIEGSTHRQQRDRHSREEDDGQLDTVSGDHRNRHRLQASDSSLRLDSTYNYCSLSSGQDHSWLQDDSLDWRQAGHSHCCICEHCSRLSVRHSGKDSTSACNRHSRDRDSRRGPSLVTDKSGATGDRSSLKSSTTTRHTRRKSSTSDEHRDSDVQQQREITSSSHTTDPYYGHSDWSRDTPHRQSGEGQVGRGRDEADAGDVTMFNNNPSHRRASRGSGRRRRTSRCGHRERSCSAEATAHEKCSQTSFSTHSHPDRSSIMYRGCPAPEVPHTYPVVTSWRGENISLSQSRSTGSKKSKHGLNSSSNSSSRNPGKSGALYNLQGGAPSSRDISQSHVEPVSKIDSREINGHSRLATDHSRSSSVNGNKVCDTNSESCGRNRNARSRSKSAEHVPHEQEESETGPSQTTRSKSYPEVVQHKRPFWASRRVLSEPKPQTEGDWLGRHVSLMSDCSREKVDNAKSRIHRMMAKSKALKSSMESLHLDFGNLEERLDKVKEMQQAYLVHADQAVRMAQEKSDRYLHLKPEPQQLVSGADTDRSENAKTEEEWEREEWRVHRLRHPSKPYRPAGDRELSPAHAGDLWRQSWCGHRNKISPERHSDLETSDSEHKQMMCGAGGEHWRPKAGYDGDMSWDSAGHNCFCDSQRRTTYSKRTSGFPHYGPGDGAMDRPPPCSTMRHPRHSGGNQNNCSRAAGGDGCSQRSERTHLECQMTSDDGVSADSGSSHGDGVGPDRNSQRQSQARGQCREDQGRQGHGRHQGQGYEGGPDRCQDGLQGVSDNSARKQLTSASRGSATIWTLSEPESDTELDQARDGREWKESWRVEREDRGEYLKRGTVRQSQRAELNDGTKSGTVSGSVVLAGQGMGAHRDIRGVVLNPRPQRGADDCATPGGEHSNVIKTDRERRYWSERMDDYPVCGGAEGGDGCSRKDRDLEYCQVVVDRHGRGRVGGVSCGDRGLGPAQAQSTRTHPGIVGTITSSGVESESETDSDSGVKVRPSKRERMARTSCNHHVTQRGRCRTPTCDGGEKGQSSDYELGSTRRREDETSEVCVGREKMTWAGRAAGRNVQGGASWDVYRSGDFRRRTDSTSGCEDQSRELTTTDRHVPSFLATPAKATAAQVGAWPRGDNTHQHSPPTYRHRWTPSRPQSYYPDSSSEGIDGSPDCQRVRTILHSPTRKSTSKWIESPTPFGFSRKISEVSPTRPGQSGQVGNRGSQGDNSARLLDSGCETDISADSSLCPSSTTTDSGAPAIVRCP